MSSFVTSVAVFSFPDCLLTLLTVFFFSSRILYFYVGKSAFSFSCISCLEQPYPLALIFVKAVF